MKVLFFIYSRKSIETGVGESVENQGEMCRTYILQKYPQTKWENIRVYEEAGVSGKNLERPQFKRMMRDVEREKPNFLVCYRLDRISRSVGDFAALIEWLNEQQVSFLCIKEEFDTSRPMGKAMMYIASVFAQLERETIAERVRDNMMLLAKTGRWLGGNAPLGYRAERRQEQGVDGRVKTACYLKENAQELAIVDEIFNAYLQTESLSKATKWLQRAGIKTRTGKEYAPYSLKLILQNPVYCKGDEAAWDYFAERRTKVSFDKGMGEEGLLAYNKRDYRKKSAPRQGMEQWIVAKGTHKGQIDGVTWVRVQEMLAGKAKRREKTAHNSYALLADIFVCGACGEKMTAKMRQGQMEKFDYICRKKRTAGREACPSKNMRGNGADTAVWDAVFPVILASFSEEAVLFLKEWADGATVAEKREFVGYFVRKVQWNESGLTVFLK